MVVQAAVPEPVVERMSWAFFSRTAVNFSLFLASKFLEDNGENVASIDVEKAVDQYDPTQFEHVCSSVRCFIS